MVLNKAEIAKLQIERAISLYLNDKDYVCAITLAGAAEELLGNILKTNGKESVLGVTYKEFTNSYPKFSQFSNDVNKIRNELKHSHENPDLDYEIHIGEDDCAVMLYRALVSYPKAVGEPTKNMQLCWNYLKENHADIFS